MARYNVMAVVINNRILNAPNVQEVFTKHGCLVKLRLGLHEAGNLCSEEGLVILQLTGEKNQIASFEKELNSIEGIEAKLIEI